MPVTSTSLDDLPQGAATTGGPLLIVAYALVSLILLGAGTFRPYYNWDLIPYIAAARSLQTTDSVSIHSYAYAEVAKVPGTSMLASPPPGLDSPFRALMRNDVAAFTEHLDFYRVRIVYNGLIYLLASSGMSPVFATHFISALSLFFATWVLFFISHGRLATSSRYIILPMALALGMIETARMSTPDGLACLAILLCVYCFLAGSRAIYLLLPLLVAIRSDLFILVVLFSLLLFLTRRYRRQLPALAVSLLCSTTLLIFLHGWFDYPGWRAIFYFTFIDRMALTTPAAFGPVDYLRALLKGMWNALLSPPFLFTLALVGVAATTLRRYDRSTSDWLRLLVVSLLYIAVRLLTFPLPDPRFLVGPYVVVALATLALLWPRQPRVNCRSNGSTP